MGIEKINRCKQNKSHLSLSMTIESLPRCQAKENPNPQKPRANTPPLYAEQKRKLTIPPLPHHQAKEKT